MSKVYLDGKQIEEHGHHRVIPASTYIAVFGSLLVLTVATVLASLWDLGSVSLLVAMGIAAAKSYLVVAYFMNLKFDDPQHTFIFVAGLLFVAIFFALTFTDVGSRDLVYDTDAWVEQRAQELEEAGLTAPPAIEIRPNAWKPTEHEGHDGHEGHEESAIEHGHAG